MLDVFALPSWASSHGLRWDPQDPTTQVRAPLHIVTEKELGRMSQLTTANQVLAVVEMPRAEEEYPAAIAGGWTLYLDGIQSPSNLGALLRIADWFDFRHVIGGPGTADLYNSKSLQASMGSFLRVRYRTGELADLRAAFPDLTVFGADLAGENIYGLRAPDRGVLVIGSEGPGIREGARSQVQRWLTIPRAGGSEAESLNAAVAAGILCGGLRNV